MPFPRHEGVPWQEVVQPPPEPPLHVHRRLAASASEVVTNSRAQPKSHEGFWRCPGPPAFNHFTAAGTSDGFPVLFLKKGLTLNFIEADSAQYAFCLLTLSAGYKHAIIAHLPVMWHETSAEPIPQISAMITK